MNSIKHVLYGLKPQEDTDRMHLENKNVSLLNLLSLKSTWESFYSYKTSLVCPKAFSAELKSFIDKEEYLPVVENILRGDSFPLPQKSIISKQSSTKKRTVYTYPYAENMVLKLLTWLLLRYYDHIFADNLYSFRPGRTAKDAVKTLLKNEDIFESFYYKADISNYFNSINAEDMVGELEKLMAADEPELFTFLKKLLEEERVLDGKKIVAEQKGIMAGTPLAAFYANLYLKDLDAHFEKAGICYARYSDDIILFSKDRQELDESIGFVHNFLNDRGLAINPEKEHTGDPSEGFVFLGFYCNTGVIDIAPVTVKKLKAKMRRKTRSLTRWGKRNELPGEKSAKAFIRIFNRKLLESPLDNELSWSHWFFPLINTTKSLEEIDHYAQEQLRYLVSGKHTKARFNVDYASLKSLGYKSLVHEYYNFDSL